MSAKYRLGDGRIVTVIEYAKEVLGRQAEGLEDVELEEIGEEILNVLMEFGGAVLLRPEGDFYF